MDRSGGPAAGAEGGRRRVVRSVLLLLALLLLGAPAGRALKAGVGIDIDSRLCGQRMVNGKKPSGSRCPCGTYRRDRTAGTFWSRLTPTCKKVMAPYRRSRHRRKRHRGYAGCHSGGYPSSPVFVRNNETETFAMCTVPKCGSSYWRMLLLELVRYPRARYFVREQRISPHTESFPTLFAFDPSILLPDSLPDSFMLVRNPFSRILSGFLNKMVWSDKGDTQTRERVFKALRVQQPPRFDATPESFLHFLRMLNATGVAHANGFGMNEHFRGMWRVCNTQLVHYDFLLKLEDMACWYPCFVDALRLGQFVHSGWVAGLGKGWVPEEVERRARNRTGPSQPPQPSSSSSQPPSQSSSSPSSAASPPSSSCFWTPADMTCDEYRASMDGIVGGSDKELLAGGCASLDGASVGGHSTGAHSRLQTFYGPEAMAIVKRLYMWDFLMFQYSPDKLG